MAKGLQDYTVNESTAPYIKAVVSDGSSAVDSWRAVHMKGTAADVTLTVNDVDVVFHLLKGHTYSICCTKSNSSGVVFLY